MSQTQSKRRIDAKHGLFMRSTLILQLRGHTVISFITLYFGSTYSSVPNKRTCTLINFRLFVPHFLTFLLNKNLALFSTLYAYSIYTLIRYWRVRLRIRTVSDGSMEAAVFPFGQWAEMTCSIRFCHCPDSSTIFFFHELFGCQGVTKQMASKRKAAKSQLQTVKTD